MVKLIKKKSNALSPRSSLGLVSFNESSHSIIKLSPELVITLSLLFSIIILLMHLF